MLGRYFELYYIYLLHLHFADLTRTTQKHNKIAMFFRSSICRVVVNIVSRKAGGRRLQKQLVDDLRRVRSSNTILHYRTNCHITVQPNAIFSQR